MRKRHAGVAVAIIVLIGVVWARAAQQNDSSRQGSATASTSVSEHGSPTASTTESLRLVADAYPLYTGAAWKTPITKTVPVGGLSFTGTSIDSVAFTNTMNPSSIIAPFEAYYASKLKNAGWSIDNDLAAGGHTGGQTGYRKGTSLLLTQSNITYHLEPADAPSECPCDVTLSVFSSQGSVRAFKNVSY